MSDTSRITFPVPNEKKFLETLSKYRISVWSKMQKRIFETFLNLGHPTLI